MRNRRILEIAAFAVLGVAAVAGWARKPSSRAATAPTAYDAASSSVSGQPLSANATVPCVDTAQVQDTAYQDDNRDLYYSNRRPVRVVQQEPERTAIRQSAYRTTRTASPVKKGRSTKKSVAIVAGSAGTGAAIGALAGGGKGAAIGALSGGAAGFVYDRMTHGK